MTEYKRDLGLKESVAIVISRIIGSGIFRTPAPIMALVGCTSLFGLVWIIGGIITILARLFMRNSRLCFQNLVVLMFS